MAASTQARGPADRLRLDLHQSSLGSRSRAPGAGRRARLELEFEGDEIVREDSYWKLIDRWHRSAEPTPRQEAGAAKLGAVPFASYPLPPLDPALESVATVLDAVLTPLGFAPGQAGAADERGQVIFCRGMAHSTDDACVDLVIDLEAAPDWRITDVRYWGHPTERFHLPFDRDGDLTTQLATLARTIAADLD